MQSSEPLMATPFATALDLGGTFVFALSGALAGVRHGFDLFGVLVLSFATATSGGIICDLLIGAGLCFGLRLLAIRRGWQLPAARRHD